MAGNTIWRGRFLRHAPLIFWIGLIFYLSTDNGSSIQTSRIIGPLFHFLFQNGSEESLQLVHAFIRKSAHFCVYGVLALLAIRSFRPSTTLIGRICPFAAVLTVALIASIDEYNQSFSPLRTGTPYDVLLDISGGVTATILYYLIFYRRSKNRPSSAPGLAD